MSNPSLFDCYAQRLKEHFWLFVFVLLTSLFVNVRYLFFVKDAFYPGEVVYSSISSLFWASLLSLLVAIPHSKLLRRMSISLVILVSVLLFVFEHYLLSAYKSVYTDSIAINILATNPAEVQEFTAIIPLPFLLVPFAVSVSLFILCYSMRKYITTIVDKFLPKKSLWIVALVASPIALACVSSIPVQYKLYHNNTPAFAFMTPYCRFNYQVQI